MKILKAPRKFQSDKKDYKILTLPNGLKVLLVKQESDKAGDIDPKLKQNLAAVALCVGSGCFEDPSAVPGLSHFLEHMIFMGSEKYPKENEFDQYVSAHGGFDNAYTECEHTLFHFDIIEKHLAGALDRFAQFFIAPTMSAESMEREMEAVESEFQSNSVDDEVRVAQIYCSMIHRTHPASNFIWGNLKTLRDDIDEEKLFQLLHAFRRRNYVANRMFLCIQSSVDMTRLERTVLKYFSDIPKGVEATSETSSTPFAIFKKNFYEKIFFVKSTTEKCKLLMTFLFPPVVQQVKFLEYLASLIDYEGSGGLTDLFMEELLALKVKTKVATQSFEGNSMFTFFTIEVNLTSQGFEDFDYVLQAVFAFLLLLKTTSIHEHKKRYREFKEIKDISLKYRKEKSSIENVQELAVNMRYFKDEDVIVGKEVCPEFDETFVKMMIEKINERKFNLMVLSDRHQKYDKIEKWFGTEYAEVEFPQPYIKLWNERWLRHELFLPKPNNFICRNFDIVEGDKCLLKYPAKIFASKCCECFYKLDSKFQLPYGFIYVFFLSPITETSVHNLNMTSIFSMCVKNLLSSQLFPATIVGYNYKLHSIDNGLVLRLSGFSEKLPLIVDIITKTMKNLQIDKTVFETFRKELKKNCYNCLVDGSLLNDDCRLAVLKKHHRSFYDRHENVDLLQHQSFKEFHVSLISSLRVKMLVQGNISEQQAMQMTKMIINNLNIESETPLLTENLSEIHKIPIGTSYVKVTSMRHNDLNSIIKNYYQVGKSTIHKECMTEFIVSVLNEPLFDTLRSHEQLGYGVACTLRQNCGVLGITITVEYQENKNSAELIDSKIDEFLTNFVDILKKTSDKDFLSAKHSIVSLKLITDSDLEKEVDRNWGEVRNGEYVFDRNKLEAFEIEKLSKQEIIKFYNKVFLSPNETRKLSVQVKGDGRKNIKMSDDDKILRNNFVREINDFKQNLEMFE